MELRLATPADAGALAADVEEGSRTWLDWAPADWQPLRVDAASMERLRARLEHPGVWCALALDGAETVGHVALSPETTEEPAPPPSGSIYLWQMFVRPRWQGSGVARALMAAAIAEADRRGFREVLLWTPRGAQRARGFYEREGFTLTGASHGTSPSGLETVQYARPLGDD